jgi:hypothetical protein
MIIIEKLENLDFRTGFGQTQDYVIEGLEKAFISKYGEDLFVQSSLILIVEANANGKNTFYHVIKDKYFSRISGELMDNLCDNVLNHLDI